MEVGQEQLVRLGKRAAEAVGLEGVRDVEPVIILDSGHELALMFSFLVQQYPLGQHGAVLRTRLSQTLRDELVQREDDRYPYIRLLTEQDWEKRERAPVG